MKYKKPPLSVQDQILKLESRKLIIPDIKRASHYLEHISYYRLSAYFKPFQPKKDQFNDACFNDILKLYLFDKELKGVLMDAIERIEVAFRTTFVNLASTKYNDTHWYEKPSHFTDKVKHKDGLKKLDYSIKTSSEAFIKHYKSVYTSPKRPPSYMAFEVVSFGWLSFYYKNLLDNKLKNKIAHHFGLNNYMEFESWINGIGEIRNACAHHSRVWNSAWTFKPKVLKKTSLPWIEQKSSLNTFKVYSILCSIAYLLKTINPKSHFSYKIQKLFIRYPKVDSNAMGFPENWENEPVWRFPNPTVYKYLYLNVFRIKQMGSFQYN